MSARRILLLDMIEKTGNSCVGGEEEGEEEEGASHIWAKVKEKVTLLFNKDIEEDFAQYYFAGSLYKIWVPLFILIVGFILVTTILITVEVLRFILLVVGVFTFGLVFFFTCHFKHDLYYARREYIMLGCVLVVECSAILIVSVDRQIGYVVVIFPLSFALLLGWTRFYIAVLHTVPFHLCVYLVCYVLNVVPDAAQSASDSYTSLICHVCFLLVSYVQEDYVRLNFKANLKLLREGRKTDKLMTRVLPGNIVPRFIAEVYPIANQYNDCTVVCVGLIDPNAREKAPADQVLFMSHVWAILDECCGRYDELVQKVNTSRDNEYIVICFRNEDDKGVKKIMNLGLSSAEVAASWALEIKYKTTPKTENEESAKKLVIGMDTGPGRVGLIGRVQVSYDFVWGSCLENARRIKDNAGDEIEISNNTLRELNGNARVVDCPLMSERGDRDRESEQKNTHCLMGIRFQLPVEVSEQSLLEAYLKNRRGSRDPRLLSLGKTVSNSTKRENIILRQYENREKFHWLTLGFSDATELKYFEYVRGNSLGHVRFAIGLWVIFYGVQRWQVFNIEQILIRVAGSIVLLSLFAISFVNRMKYMFEVILILGFCFVGLSYILMSHFGVYIPSGFLVFPFFSMALSTIRFKFAAVLTWMISAAMCGFLISSWFYNSLLLPYIILLSSISTVAGYNIHKSRRKYFLLSNCVQQEKERSEMKLRTLLPARVASKLKEVSRSVVFQFKNVGMAVAILSNFDAVASSLSANDTVILLNDIFSQFDSLVTDHSLCRIKTVRSSYVFAQGLNLEGGSITDDLSATLRCAYKMQDCIQSFNTQHNVDLNLTIAVHYGNIFTGVIGASKFRVDIWGEDINYTYKFAEQMSNNPFIPTNPIVVSAQVHAIVIDQFEFGEATLNGDEEKIHYLKKVARESICNEDDKHVGCGVTPYNSVAESSTVAIEVFAENSEEFQMETQ